MASPAFRALSSNTGTGTSFTMTEPSGAASGDGLLYMNIVGNSHSGYTPPSGWTAVPNCNAINLGAFSATCYVYYVLRGGSAPSLGVSWTTSQYWEWSCWASSGVLNAANFIDASGAGTPSVGTQPDPPSITTLTTDTLVYALGFNWAGWGGAASPPSGYTIRQNGSGLDHVLASLPKAATGGEDPGTFSAAGSSDEVGMTIALASNSGGGGGGGLVSRKTLLGVGKNRLRRDEWEQREGGRIYTRRAA